VNGSGNWSPVCEVCLQRGSRVRELSLPTDREIEENLTAGLGCLVRKKEIMMVPKDDKDSAARGHITPDRFFSNDKEKTKLNWFLFELALEIERCIAKERRLTIDLRRKGVDDHRVRDFCVHYAKHMKKEILDKLAGRTTSVGLGYLEIERFFPQIGDRLVDKLLTVVGKAWESQTGACVVCPTRCISERDERAPMFDDPVYWE
jgi:hypothetical protein